MTSRVSALGQGLALGLVCVGGPSCTAEPVEARAIWVDEFSGDGRRTIHVYDRGQLDSFDVLGGSEPVERVILDPHGRGVLARVGDHRGAWFDLDDGRRFPIQLPNDPVATESPIEFANQGLIWIDGIERSLAVIPLAWGLPLDYRDDGTVEPLDRGEALDWVVASSQAPIVLVASETYARVSFLRFPNHPDQPLAIALEAETEAIAVPASDQEFHSCSGSLECFAQVAVEPEAALAILSVDRAGPWQVFDRRAAAAAGPLELPTILAEAAAGPGLRLLAVLDPDVSAWIGPGQLYRFDRTRGVVANLPIFAIGPYRWTTADRGRAVILSSSSGPVYRIDRAGPRAISLDTTTCAAPSDPVVAPSGRFVAWTCLDLEAELTSASGVVVRVSSAGLERFVGVPMATLAIDDAGDLLLYSVESSLTDAVDGIGPTSVPRNLFALSGDGVLTRIDELEPAPAPVLLSNETVGAYIQGVALER